MLPAVFHPPHRSQPAGRKARREDGSAAVELAFVLPILVTLLGGVIQFGALFFIQNEMTGAARSAARALAVGQATSTQAETIALNQLAQWPMTFSVTVTSPNPSDPNDKDFSVQITVPAAEATFVDILGMFASRELTSKVTMRDET